MELKIEDVSSVEKKLIVEVPWDQVSTKLGLSYRDLSKKVAIKGFRKGKVPRSVLERMFGKKVRAEVAGEFVRDSYITAIQKHELAAVGDPRIENELTIEKGKTFGFECFVDVKGDGKAEKYKGLEVFRRPVVVEDKDLEHELNHLVKKFTDLKTIEGRDKLTDQDVVTLTITGTIGEHDVNQPSANIDLGDKEHEPLPGILEKLLGLPLDTKDHAIEMVVADDAKDESIQGKECKLKVSVVEAQEKVIPKLDDEFAKDTEKGQTMSEVKATLRTEIEERKKNSSEDEVRKQALQKLIEANQIPVAKSFVEQVIQTRFNQFERMAGMQPSNRRPSGELRDSLADGAEDEVRGQLLLESVAEIEKIEVSEDELNEKLTEMSGGLGKSMGRVRAEMERSGRLESLKFQMKQNKALDFLVENAKVTDGIPPEPKAKESEKTELDEASVEK